MSSRFSQVIDTVDLSKLPDRRSVRNKSTDQLFSMLNRAVWDQFDLPENKKNIRASDFAWTEEVEEVFMNTAPIKAILKRLTEKIGEASVRLFLLHYLPVTLRAGYEDAHI
jgi:hypothetical protein